MRYLIEKKKGIVSLQGRIRLYLHISNPTLRPTRRAVIIIAPSTIKYNIFIKKEGYIMNSTKTPAKEQITNKETLLDLVRKEARQLDRADGELDYNLDILEYMAMMLNDLLEKRDTKATDYEALVYNSLALKEALPLARVLYDYILKTRESATIVSSVFNFLWDITAHKEGGNNDE